MHRPFAHRHVLLWFASSMVFVSAACGFDSTIVDASVDALSTDGATDGGATDSGPNHSDSGLDGGGTLDGSLVDVGPDAPRLHIEGQLTYVRRPLTERGLQAPIDDTLANVQVLLLRGGTEVASTRTNTAGAFSFSVAPDTGFTVRAIAAVDVPASIQVTDFDRHTYAFEADVVDNEANLYVDREAFSGALAILDTMAEGLTFAQGAFSRADAFPPLQVFWERRRSTPLDTSYASEDTLWILGGPLDTDEFDTPVLLHELGHYLQWVYDFYDPVEGDPHAAEDTDPRLAWGEGWASFFSSLARGSGFYGDSFGLSIGYDVNLDDLPNWGEYVCRPRRGMNQTLSEWVVAASLYKLATTGNLDEQREHSFSTLTDWLVPRTTDRGLPGIELVDFLDGYLCTTDGTQDALVEQVVIDERRFPYDLDPPCPKPGHAARTYLSIPPAVPLPGFILQAPNSRPLRVIAVDRSRSSRT